MSRCGKTQLLENAREADMSPAQSEALRAHVAQCAVCRHEANWLESEALLFAERRSRDEVDRLWQGVAARASPRWPRVHGLRRGVLATAAVVLVALGAGAKAVSPGAAAAHGEGEPLMSIEVPVADVNAVLASVERGPSLGACVLMTPGVGIACDADVRATFDE